jgi:hypothetical protein
MKKIIFVVSRNQPDLVPRLEKERRGGDIEIVVDRRIGERRTALQTYESDDRRKGERRMHATSAVDLIGVAVVVMN